MTTNSRHRMADDMFTHWIDTIEDEELLAQWEEKCANQRKLLRGVRLFTSEQIKRGLCACKRGDALYTEKDIPFGMYNSNAAMQSLVYFYHWQPRKKRVWITTAPQLKFNRSLKQPTELRWLSLESATDYQLARTQLNVRRRAPKLELSPPKRKPKHSAHDVAASLEDLQF